MKEKSERDKLYGNSVRFVYVSNKHDFLRQKKSDKPFIPRRKPEEEYVPDVLDR